MPLLRLVVSEQPPLPLPLAPSTPQRCQWSERCHSLAAGTVDRQPPGSLFDVAVLCCTGCADRYSLDLNLWMV